MGLVIGNWQGAKLQPQAFAQIASPHSRRIERAKQAQGHRELMQQFRHGFLRIFSRHVLAHDE